MNRHLRLKFGYEIFVNIDGYPMTLDFFPKDAYVDAWRAIYLIDGIGLDEWYIKHMQKTSEKWKTLGSSPFWHLEYLEVEG